MLYLKQLVILELVTSTNKAMTVSKEWLENKIKELNDWLFSHTGHGMYVQTERNRDYYVRKLIELEENNLPKIKV